MTVVLSSLNNSSDAVEIGGTTYSVTEPLGGGIEQAQAIGEGTDIQLTFRREGQRRRELARAGPVGAPTTPRICETSVPVAAS